MYVCDLSLLLCVVYSGNIGDECFVHCSQVVPSSEVEMYGQYIGRG